MTEWIVRVENSTRGAWGEFIQELVRCKNCKHLYESWGEKYCHRGLTLTYTSDEWFCPKGERKDDADND